MSLPKAPDVGQTNESDTLQDFGGTGPFCLQHRQRAPSESVYDEH